VIRVLVLMVLLLAAHPPFFESSQPLPRPVRAELKTRWWHPGCPVPLSRLRLLHVSYWDFSGRVQRGELVVNRDAAAPLAKVFRRLYRLHFPIRHMHLADAYGPRRSVPADGDVTAAFECRQAVPSPCTVGKGTGSWSEHAYGEAIDLNPIENPYSGCQRTRVRASLPYLDRSRLRRGMVTSAVIRAFRSIGWGWGGDWTGSTKDYMHFSASGH
jgi:hypothetical protein